MPPNSSFTAVQPTDGDGRVGAALPHYGGKSPRRMAVILKLSGAEFERIIWCRSCPCGRRLGESAKRSMSGHPQIPGYPGGDDAKPNGVIVGREGGSVPGNVGGDWPGRV